MSTQLTVAPKIKIFSYNVRGFKRVNAKMDADLAAFVADATRHTLAYDTGSAIFVVGEVVSGATGVGVVTGLAVGSTSASGTLFLDLTTAGFVGAEAISGSIAGAASVVAATSEVLVPVTIGSVRTAVGEHQATLAITYSDQAQA